MASSTLDVPVSQLVSIKQPHSDPESGHKAALQVDIKALKRDLSKKIEGEVRFDAASIALYATDSSNFREPPLGVVVPRTLEDVVNAHRICSRHGAPILSRGCGTSLSGETVNFAVVIDHSKYLTHIGKTDVARRLVTVEPGAINEQVNLRTGKQNRVLGTEASM
jgi:FAD/FMN-containing dehydrogenase